MGKKYKIKLKNKNETVVKKGIAYIGENREGDVILVDIKTRGLLDRRKIEAESQVYEELKIPKKEKKYVHMTDIEKKIYDLRGEDDAQKSLILCYDETNPKVVEKKNEISTMIAAINVASYFDMDETVIDVEGNEITHWERWDIKDNKLISLVRFIVDEEKGLGLGLDELSIINQEIIRIKQGQQTIGEAILERDLEKEDIEAELEKVRADLDGKEKE